MKRKVIYIIIVSIFNFVACNNNSKNENKKEVIRIGILQNKPQEWADALKLGFYDGLTEQGFKVGDDIIIISRSAAGDPISLSTVAQTLVRDNKIKIIYTLGTQSSQEVFNLSKNKCIVFGAVTDPVKAGFFEKDLNHPKGNITGTQDLWPYPAQFELIKELLPNIKTIGTIYNPSEINSQVSIQHIKDECKKNGITLKERTISSDQEIEIALNSLISQNIDLFFIPADNTAQAAASIIINFCDKNKIPVFTGIPGIVKQGAIATVGTNYYELGKVNAQQVKQIISQNKKCSEIPVSIADKGDIYLNIKALDNLNIKYSDELLKKAFKVFK
ncbi:MAG: ABC transporter substrate-binding protein [Chlorobi bacterium]|nr:ABC transporter substrate-binding protein [Chlorobiota bacterium]